MIGQYVLKVQGRAKRLGGLDSAGHDGSLNAVAIAVGGSKVLGIGTGIPQVMPCTVTSDAGQSGAPGIQVRSASRNPLPLWSGY
jgi:hypothetical protein